MFPFHQKKHDDLALFLSGHCCALFAENPGGMIDELIGSPALPYLSVKTTLILAARGCVTFKQLE